MNELRNSKSDDQLEELLLLTEQMQEELEKGHRISGPQPPGGRILRRSPRLGYRPLHGRGEDAEH